MSNKLKALIKTVGFFALASIGALIFVYATLWIPLEFIVYSLIFGMASYGFWVMYQVNLERLDREDERSSK